MARVKMLDVFLERQWSGHEADEIVTVEDYTANSMVKKGYGRIITSAERKKIESANQPEKSPEVETADAPVPAEKAVVTPKMAEKPQPPVADDKGRKADEAKADKKKK
jgi:hypothetical protein